MAGTIAMLNAGGGTVLTFAADSSAASRYELISAGETGARRRRDVATSPYVDYEAEINSVRDALTYQLVVRCVGTSTADCRALRDALTAAAEQSTWQLHVTLDGVTDAYACHAADWQLNAGPASSETGLLLGYRVEVTLTIPAKRS